MKSNHFIGRKLDLRLIIEGSEVAQITACCSSLGGELYEDTPPLPRCCSDHSQESAGVTKNISLENNIKIMTTT